LHGNHAFYATPIPWSRAGDAAANGVIGGFNRAPWRQA
jgi:hypothetical protein